MVSSRPAWHFCEGAGTGQRLQLYEDPAQSEPTGAPNQRTFQKVFFFLSGPMPSAPARHMPPALSAWSGGSGVRERLLGRAAQG